MRESRGVHYGDPSNIAFRTLKAACGWTGVKIATLLDLTPAVVSQYLHGHTRPSTLALKALERAIEDAATGRAGPAPDGTVTHEKRGLDPADVVNALRRVEAKAKAVIEEIAGIEAVLGLALKPGNRRRGSTAQGEPE